MDSINTVLSRIRSYGNRPALFWKGQEQTYAGFCRNIDVWRGRLPEAGIGRGTICGFLGEYSPNTCALIFALIEAGAILVPFTRAVEPELPSLAGIAGVQALFRFSVTDSWTLEYFKDRSRPPLIESFLERGEPGLVVFTSGSTGAPKGILHDCDRVMHKFIEERPGWRTVLFLMMDHFGGFNTLLSTFAHGGVGVCLPDRNPESVCRAIQESCANLLPATPTFLNLLIASRAYRQFEISSIELITYGTEVMPQATLEGVRAVFPNAKIKQTYGLSELGVLPSQSEGDDSLFVKIGRKGFEVKVVDNTLWIRSESNMVGYLNAPNPFDEEGWLCTGDQVEVRGGYMRILGRQSDVINVGGQKVFPVEVETVLLAAGNVRDAIVYGARHQIMGQVVYANVALHSPEDPGQFVERIRKECLAKLARFKVPVKFTIVDDLNAGPRFKKSRRDPDATVANVES